MADIVCYYQNCRGIRTKLHTLYMNILSHAYDVIILTETWLIPEIDNCEFIDQRYTVYRRDRNRSVTGKRDGGGVLVAVLKGLRPMHIISEYRNALLDNIEDVCVCLPSSCGLKRHIIAAVYIPPKTSIETYSAYLELLATVLEDNSVVGFSLIGDYNLPEITWVPRDGCAGALECSTSTPVSTQLSNFMSLHDASQYNFIKNNQGNILDLLISNIECRITPLTNIILPKDNHHPPFSFNFIFNTIPLPTMRRRSLVKYNFHKANYELIIEDLDKLDWSSLLNTNNVEEAVEIFYNIVFDIIKKHAPPVSSRSARYPVWFTSSLIHIAKNKQKS